MDDTWLIVEGQGLDSDRGARPSLHPLGRSSRYSLCPGHQDVWDLLIEEVEARLFWDADWEMGDVFLDLHGIDPDYFTAVSGNSNTAVPWLGGSSGGAAGRAGAGNGFPALGVDRIRPNCGRA